MITHVVVVSRDRPDLYSEIRCVFFKDSRYLLIFDRRRERRRRTNRLPEFDRRAVDRRARADVDSEIQFQGWVTVEFEGGPLEDRSSLARSLGPGRVGADGANVRDRR